MDRLAVDANGLTFTVRVAGPDGGRPVLLLHGFPQTSWSWWAQLAALSDAGYRVAAPDQRGYSAGARPPEVADYAVGHLVDDVLALADALDMDTFDLVGHDWGGMVAWVVAARHPARVRSLSVISTPHPLALRQALQGSDPEQAGRSAYMDAFRQPETPEKLLLGDDHSGSGLRGLLTASGLNEVDAMEFVAVLTQPGAMTAALNWYRATDGGDVDGLPQIVAPTLYVWSTGDAFLGRSAAEGTAVFVTGPYTFVALEGVNHWIPESAPAELSRLLLDHLSTT